MRIRRGLFAHISIRLRQWNISPRTSIFVVTSFLCVSAVFVVMGLLHTVFAAPPCPCTVFTPTQPSSAPTVYSEPGGIEVGFKFRSDQAGYISGIRFYKGTGMDGAHTATLWNKNRQRMAQAVSVSESASGWQQVDFSPVAINSGEIYTASVFMTDGKYSATSNFFNSAVTNSPLTAPANLQAHDGVNASQQGMYNASGTSAFPNDSFNAGNYWIDVSYVGAPTVANPKIVSQSPLADTEDIPVNEVTLTAAFDGALDPATVNDGNIEVKDEQGTLVGGTVSYLSSTQSLSFVAETVWKANETYTVTAKGNGSSSAVRDMQGRTLAVDTSWSFMTSSTPFSCPCKLKSDANPAGSVSYKTQAANGIEVGLKVVPKVNGYLTALRFYKPITNTESSHTGHIWSSTGALLATVIFTDESDYGWQEMKLATPLPVTMNQVYVISYGITSGEFYQAINQGVAQSQVSSGMTAFASGDVRNQATGSGTANGLYASTKGTYPTQTSTEKPDYYVDAVFSANTTDTIRLAVTSTSPSDESYATLRSTPISATFNRALDGTTVNTSTVRLYDAQNIAIPGTVIYDGATHGVQFSPTSLLDYNKTYRVSLSDHIKDINGIPLADEQNWSFTTGGVLTKDMNQGNGGPILVVSTNANPSSLYYTEILKTEGFNYFDVKDSTELSPALLKQYKAVVLTSMPLSQTQVDMFSSWVTTGGSLITMRPDKKLSGLLGLSDTGMTNTNQYLRTNTGTPVGTGIVDETIQYKGIADLYERNGAESAATLYSNASTATVYPAVTTHAVGSGMAMAMTYDLAQSVIGLHQGNKAWSAQDRDGDTAIRTNDLFYGSKTGDIQPDWLDSSKMDIPQADEQQRLFANMVTEAMKKSLPAPRFNYLPNGHKAALVLAGDDHRLYAEDDYSNRTMSKLMNESPVGCSVVDWQCVRAAHYVYATAPLTIDQAHLYTRYGFEIGNHPSVFNSCYNYATFNLLNVQFASDMTAWYAKYGSLPQPQTSRFHCYSWADWDMMPRADAANGIRYDLNSVAYPASWVGTNGSLVTGSGMNMRLTDTTGAMLDVRQGVTNFENTATSEATVLATIDNALGVPGYYGLFGSHYDMTDNYDSTLVAAAKSRNIPIISSLQALEWLDARNSSNFSNLESRGVGRETFTIDTSEGAHGLQAMVPKNDAGGSLATLNRNGQSASYQTQIIKGVEYAVFNARAGEYDVTYSDYVAPVDTDTDISTPDDTPDPQPRVATITTPQDAKKSNSATSVRGDVPETETEDGDDSSSQDLKESSTVSNEPDAIRTDTIENSNNNPSDVKEEQDWRLVTVLGGTTAVVVVGGAGWIVFRRRSL